MGGAAANKRLRHADNQDAETSAMALKHEFQSSIPIPCVRYMVLAGIGCRSQCPSVAARAGKYSNDTSLILASLQSSIPVAS
eukprot:1160742-Pelagomonas_calceolata.AAC.4